MLCCGLAKKLKFGTMNSHGMLTYFLMESKEKGMTADLYSCDAIVSWNNNTWRIFYEGIVRDAF